MHQDIEVLSGRFGNRRGTSEYELSAASYLYERFKLFSPFTYLDSFLTIESIFLLFAMYYTEFLVVAIIAWGTTIASLSFGFKISGIATIYGIFLFVAYLAESNGLRLVSRFIPSSESQNVVAPFHVEKPKRLIVVTAGYDTQVDGILSKLLKSGYAHWVHRCILILMIAVIVTTAASDLAAHQGSSLLWASMLRWSAIACLLGAALSLFVHDRYGEDVRGANNNASGVGTLLNLAEEMHSTPLEHSDVWLVALGNSYGSQEGIRHILDTVPQSVEETYIINLQGVGCGKLVYLTKEGFMNTHPYRKKLIDLADELAPQYRIQPGQYSGLPTPTHWPSQHGYSALSIMGLEDGIDSPHAWSCSDRHTEIDDESIKRATAFSSTLLHSLDSAN